jgi:Ca-activated chloride channel family protein
MAQQLGALLALIQFQHPGWLWAGGAWLLVLAWLAQRRQLVSLRQVTGVLGSARYRHPQWPLLRHAGDPVAQRSGAGAVVRRWLSYAVLIATLHGALAYPYVPGAQLPMPATYRDVMFLLDTSISMVLRDYQMAGQRVDRMTLLKSVMTHFIDGLDGNRIGLIAFSEQAYSVVPLTADYNLLRTMVQRLEPAVLTGRNSDPGNALLYALRQLARQVPPSVAEKPVLVLLTDVNRPRRDVDPRAVADFLRRQGYRLHTIGIGATSIAADEARAAGLLYEPANIGLLKVIAAAGGGGFYWADSADSLNAAMRAIQAAERRSIDGTAHYLKVALYPWPLGAALLWLVLVQWWPSRRAP